MLCEWLLHPSRRAVGPEARQWAAEVAAAAGAGLEDTMIAAKDGIPLRGWFFRCGQPSGKAVVLLHGQGDSRIGMLGLVQPFLAHGYDVLAIDSRAQGQSGGTEATYGLREADDVRRWTDWLASAGEKHIFGLGESMGAAILLQSAGNGSRFEAVAAESAFSTLREAAYDRFGGWKGRTIFRPVIEAGMVYGWIRYGLPLGAISPIDTVASTRVPVLLIHGTADRNIPPDHSRRLRGAGHGRIELWEVPGAGHTRAHGQNPAEFERRVFEWFEAAGSRG